MPQLSVVIPAYNEQDNVPRCASEVSRLLDSHNIDYELIFVNDGSPSRECVDYAVLRWTSLTGATRQHAFPIFAIENSVDDAVTLASLGDGFAVTKNVSNGFVIRLTGLTAYGVWYYNDMLNANDLHATVDGSGITTEQTLAMVEGNTMVMPQGGGFFTFEAKIKYRHYDTF